MRSVLIAIYELRAEEIFVIGHHDCGMNNINPTGTLEKMVTQGGIPLQSTSHCRVVAIRSTCGLTYGSSDLLIRSHSAACSLAHTRVRRH